MPSPHRGNRRENGARPTPGRSWSRRTHASPARLDPTGRIRLPQRTTLLRTALVALLLLTAAGVLYRGTGGSPAPAVDPPATPGSRPTPSAGWPTTPPGAHPAWPVPPSPTGDRLPIPAGMVGVPVGLGSPSALTMLRPGDRVDLLLVPADGEPDLVAGDVAVLAVAAPEATVFLALSPDQARQVVASTARFAVIVRP